MGRPLAMPVRTMGLACALLATSACGPRSRPAPPLGSLRVEGQPAAATVTIDDRYAGPLELIAKRGVALPEGVHRVTVQADGFFPEDRVVAVRRGAPARLAVTLVPVPR